MINLMNDDGVRKGQRYVIHTRITRSAFLIPPPPYLPSAGLYPDTSHIHPWHPRSFGGFFTGHVLEKRDEQINLSTS